MLKKVLIFVFLVLISFSCGDDPDESIKINTDCESTASAIVEGSTVSFGEPVSATLVDLNFESGSELLIVWKNDEATLNLQVVMNEAGLSCFPQEKFQMKSLSSNFSILSFQYIEGLSNIASVSNIFIEDGGDGWLEITACDEEEDLVSVKFEFDAVTLSGDIIQVKSGVSENVCFVRTK